jgi:ABC-type glycerol-3-phosphate transport system substrate-binding protein
MYKGKPYGVNSGSLTSWACVWYNKNLVKKAKLKDPADLLSSKTWTWDKWVEYSTAISKLSTQSGKVYGTNVPHPLAFITSNGGKAVKSINNKDVWSLDAPEAIDSLKFLKNVASSNYTGGTPEDFANGNLGFLYAFSWETGFSDNMADKWGLLPYPIGPNTKDFTAYNEELQLMTLPKSGKHPKEAARIWTELSKPYPGVDIAREAYSNTLSDDKDIETALMMQTKFSLDRYWGYQEIQNLIYAQDNSALNNAISDKATRPVEERVKDITPAAQAAIDKLWAKYK